MKSSILILIFPICLAAAGTVALRSWMAPYPEIEAIIAREPDPAGEVNQVEMVDPGWPGRFKKFDVPAPDADVFEERWANFRGPNHDNIYQGAALNATFGAAGPPQAWSMSLGDGYASPAVAEGRVYLLDYDKATQSDVLRCWRLDDGRELWQRAYTNPMVANHGITRTVAATDGDVVVTIGPKLHVMACDAKTGDFLWSANMVKDYGSAVPDWYAGQCPLIENGRLILAPAGESVLVTALDLKTGKPIWTSPNTQQWKQTHVSILPMTLAGRRVLVYSGSHGVAGVDASTGKRLFTNTDWRVSIATVATPVHLGEGLLFLSGGYGAGSMFMQIDSSSDPWQAVSGKRLKPAQFGSEQQTPIFYDDHIFGVLPKNGANRQQMVCLNRDGETIWTSGSADRFGLGAYIIADGMLWVVGDDGFLTTAKATPAGWSRVSRGKVLPGHGWGPIAVADGYMLVRDLTELRCLKVGKK